MGGDPSSVPRRPTQHSAVGRTCQTAFERAPCQGRLCKSLTPMNGPHKEKGHQVRVWRVIGMPGATNARLAGEETRLRSAGCMVSRGPGAGFARRARDGSQGLLVPGSRTSETLSRSPARRADGVLRAHLVGPPGRRTIQKRKMGRGSADQGLKPRATTARPTGEETNARLAGEETRLRWAGRVVSRGPRAGFTPRARDGFARRARDGSQGLQSLDPWTRTSETLSPVPPPGGRTECDACTSSVLRAEEQYKRGGWQGAFTRQGLKAPCNERAPYGRRMDRG